MNETNTTQRKFRPKFALYKPNGKGTGCAAKMELHPAHDDTDGSIWATFANQLTIGDRQAPNPSYPRFDWEHSICVKLDFQDLTRILQVFRGECEAIGEGKGLYHSSPRGATIIGLRHHVEPANGYTFDLHRSGTQGSSDTHARITLAPNEAMGLCAAIEQALGVICFGIPAVIERDVSGYRQSVKGAGHGQNS